MTLFSQTITDFWGESFNHETFYSDDHFHCIINPNLEDNRRVMVLTTADDKVYAVITPAIAAKLQLSKEQPLSEVIFRNKLHKAGILLHGADHIFYYTKQEKSKICSETVAEHIRQLTVQDTVVFSKFEDSASEQDLDDAYVELDHWAVFGSFAEGHLVCASSMYPWGSSKLADLGVLTLPPFRGQGHARKVVRAISQYAYGKGYEPQYRCQLDNTASVSLAKASGLTLYAQWEVISPDSPSLS
ncbi:GNAT family N-acetyltransferase [Pseudogracilibacillus auburnensis]|uniref:GNAT family N-acetyltransferase n=1 Tax=Pseudogracilibacillus auburnensis TaxID=1494959 RepID=UPI001A963A62|nr:GNAT family N-acetyltransferase [Pseudogracilibacillus auburnensis]MBO1001120.1 GNAT family N-acetyltransferase [Pseudogracilibacillus auburnensis]